MAAAAHLYWGAPLGLRGQCLQAVLPLAACLLNNAQQSGHCQPVAQRYSAWRGVFTATRVPTCLRAVHGPTTA